MQAHPAPVLSFFTWLSPRQMPAPQRGAVTHHRARSVGRRSSPAQQHHLTWLLQSHQQQPHPCGIGNQHLRQRLRLPCEQSGLLPLLLLHQALPQVPVLLCWPLPRSHQSKAAPVKPGSLKRNPDAVREQGVVRCLAEAALPVGCRLDVEDYNTLPGFPRRPPAAPRLSAAPAGTPHQGHHTAHSSNSPEVTAPPNAQQHAIVRGWAGSSRRCRHHRSSNESRVD